MIKIKNSQFTNLDSERKYNSGFTIVELIVSIGLFIVVSLIGVGALLSVIGVNKKTQSVQSVMNNLSFAVEGMSKTIRVGTTYYCDNVIGEIVPSNLDTPRDCSSGGNLLAFEGSSGDENDSSDQIVYRLNGNQIERSIDGGSTFIDVTAPEVVVTEGTGLRFYVLGTSPTDNLQPKVIITVDGLVNLGKRAISSFNLQTSVSQREIDG